MKITKMLMLEVGTYDDMYQRPYMSHVEGQQLQQLRESTAYGRNLTPAALSAVGADIIRPSTTVSDIARVANGYDQPRMCFMMEVEFPGTAVGGMTQVEYLTGYTDEVGVSTLHGGNHLTFNPNMRLYFNNVIQATRRGGNTQFGRQHDRAVNSGFQLITSDYRPQITSLHNTSHLMRPQDVFTSLSMESTRAIMGDHQVYDTRATHGPERVAVSHRRNTLPGTYLSSLLTTWRHESESADNDPSTLFSQMASKVAEPTIARMRTLSSLATQSELRTGGCVTWDELCSADDTGTLEDRVMVTMAVSRAHRSSLSNRGDFQVWNGNGSSAIVAAAFVQAVPGFMMALLLTVMEFTITNKTLDGSWMVEIGGFETFNTGDVVEDQIELFKYKLITELMPGLSRGNSHIITIVAQFDVMSQTFIQVDMDDGMGLVPYMAPSFCDGLYSSTRAPNADTLENFSGRLSKIMYGLEEDVHAGGQGYEPDDQQFNAPSNNNHNRGNRSYGNSGTL